MKFEKAQMNLSTGIDKEWLITNGIGGYSASTILGINTRKYHGLLVAPLAPPARRYVILSKVDESVDIGNEKYNLYSNICRNYISEGYKYLEQFEKIYIPVFTYKVKELTIKKYIALEHGKNTVCILYRIINNGPEAKFTITPILNFRDFHTMSTNWDFNIKQEINKKKVKLLINGNSQTPIYMHISHGKYIEHSNDIFRNMFYIEEEKRGFFPEENLAVPGRYEINIPSEAEKEISFICSLEENIEEKNAKTIINKEIIRINELMYQSGMIPKKHKVDKQTPEQAKMQEMLRYFTIAIDNFIVFRPSFRYHTIIAGYPWFLDWGRDSLISFEGLLLITKKYKIAKEVLLTIIRDIKMGLVPNGYSGYDSRPLYNSVDSSLLLFEQVQKYLDYTSDYELIKTKFYDKMASIIENYTKGIDIDDNNIYLDKDFLISSGTEYTQNTWMDAKYKDHAFTPRNGKAVEINSMWYNALKIMEALSKRFHKRKEAKHYGDMAERCRESFKKAFYNQQKKCLYDVIGDSKVRPNQLFAISLTYPVIEPTSEIAMQIIQITEKKLLNKYGLKTLAKGEKDYIDIYEGNSFKRDSSYHQGITWPWLLGLYYDALKNIFYNSKDKEIKKELEEKITDFKKRVEKTFLNEMSTRGTIGTISEIYDSKSPYLPKGAMAQAWSVAEIFRIIYEKL